MRSFLSSTGAPLAAFQKDTAADDFLARFSGGENLPETDYVWWIVGVEDEEASWVADSLSLACGWDAGS